MRHNTNRKRTFHYTRLTQTYNIHQNYKARKKLSLTMALHNKPPTDPHTVTTTDIKTNVCHIHTSFVSRQLATRGNYKIMRTPPPHISSSEEILPRPTPSTLAQLRTNKSPFLKSYLHNAIITLVDRVTNALDTGKYIVGVFLDLKKAFDTVYHSILLNKLEKYGIQGNILNWLKS